MSAYTKGPWIWAKNFNGLYGAGPENEVLCHAAYEGMWLPYGSRGRANARLIAAAPELLEALQKVDAACSNSDSALGLSLAMDALIEEVRAAIQKATAGENE